jgi:putative ABC transport system ATP-binding protein
MSDPILVGTGLRRRFGPTDALRGADLALARGEIVAVREPSGAGKSTLLHCLAGILRPDAGEVWFDGGADRRPPGALVLGFRVGVPSPIVLEVSAGMVAVAAAAGAVAIVAERRLALRGAADRLAARRTGGRAPGPRAARGGRTRAPRA